MKVSEVLSLVLEICGGEDVSVSDLVSGWWCPTWREVSRQAWAVSAWRWSSSNRGRSVRAMPKSLLSCLTLCNPRDHSLPDFLQGTLYGEKTVSSLLLVN